MAKITSIKYTGPTSCDLNNVSEYLQDVAPRGLLGLRAEKDGLPEVLTELQVSFPIHGEAAEIHPRLYEQVVTQTEVIRRLDVHIPTLEKLLEVSQETRAKTVNDREDVLSKIAQQIEDKAERDKLPELRAPFQKTLRYRSLNADKAAATRKKNELKAEADTEQPDQPE